MKGNRKSRMQMELSFYLHLSENLANDVLLQAGINPARDVKRLRLRTKSEGFGFLTKTLPSLGKAVQSALLGEKLRVPHFKLIRGTALPHFLKDALSLVFTPDGWLIDDPDVTMINDLIQLCMLHYKLEVPYDPETEDEFLQSFVQTDESLPDDLDYLEDTSDRLGPIVLDEACELIRELFRDFDPMDIVPRHGPGAVSDGKKNHEKYCFTKIFPMTQEVYPAEFYYYRNSARAVFDNWDLLDSCDQEHDPVAKVFLVPKDSRGPRIISCEPSELQYLQQGLGRAIMTHLENHRWTRGHINFSDQNVNRALAMIGSMTHQWATIDMKEASDRVSQALVKRVTKGSVLYKPLQALRSVATELPTGELVFLKKYSPMGSALCFPIESLCFWALAVSLTHVVTGCTPQAARDKVFVYGDDIICATGIEKLIFSVFPRFGLKLNTEKSCYTGDFRESCGCDAFRGFNITPIKLKKRQPQSFKDGQGYVSYIAFINAMRHKCYYRTAEYAEKHIEGIFGSLPISQRVARNTPDKTFGLDTTSLPEASDSAPALRLRTKGDMVNSHLKSRINHDFQRREHLVLTPKSPRYTSWRSEWGELHRHLVSNLEAQPGLYTSRRRVSLKRRWVCLAY